MAKIRCQRNPSKFEIHEWKKHLPSSIDDCPDSILRESMAYGDTPSQVGPVLQAKLKNFKDTSIDKIIDPLKKLDGKLSHSSSSDLFRAVLDISDNQIDVSF